MKLKLFSLLIFFATACNVKEQDAKTILKKSFDKCQTIQDGSYDMTRYMKYMSEKDTVENSYTCDFKRIKNDTIFPASFHFKVFEKGKYQGEVLYDGSDLVTAYTTDSVATVISKTKWPQDFANYREAFEFYTPMTTGKLYPMHKNTDFNDSVFTFKLIGEEQINHMPAYHVQINRILEKVKPGAEGSLQDECHYWISQADFVPVQFSRAFAMVMNDDTMYQYEKIVLNKYALNNFKDDQVLTLKSIPAFYKVKDFVPYEEPKPLPLDTIAPGWEILSTNDEKVNLKDLKGQLVLVDFFYKSCYPCMQALPALQALHEKYKGKGFKMIGIDPNDTKEDGIADFLKKRGVTYTVLLGGQEAAKQYRVYGYPTMFLISKTGKIIFTQVGFGEGVEKDLEVLVIKNL